MFYRMNGLRAAIIDMRYLLSRGYNRKSAANYITSRYSLTRRERAILYRAVYPPNQAYKHMEKMVQPCCIIRKKLSIDGFNTLITLESALKGKTVIECDDGFIRDVSAVFGRFKFSDITLKALNLIFNFLEKYPPAETVFFFDSQVSFSGELASKIRELLSQRKLKGTAKTVKKNDKAVLLQGGIVASSDSIIIEKANAVLDLAGQIIKKHFQSLIFNIKSIK